MIEVPPSTAKALAQVRLDAVDSDDKPTYTAIVRRDPETRGYWLAQLEEEPRVHTFGRTMTETVQHLEDATRLWFRLPGDQKAHFKLRLGEPIDEELDKTETLRNLRNAITNLLEEATQRLVNELILKRELSRREAGTILGLSHQRIQQLADTKDVSAREEAASQEAKAASQEATSSRTTARRSAADGRVKAASSARSRSAVRRGKRSTSSPG